MVTPAEVLKIAAADMNDSAQVNYTNDAMLPYFNMALEELIQKMVENDIPLTDKTSSPNIDVEAGQTEIAFVGTTAQLPPDLVEPEIVWESDDDGLTWTPMGRVDMIDPNISSSENINMFGIYEWNGDKIVVPPSTSDITIKIRYLRKLVVTPLTIDQINIPLLVDAKLFLGHKTAALCATFINQDEMRAGACNELAEQAIERELNIPTKGRQQIATRRRPFRAAFKARNVSW